MNPDPITPKLREAKDGSGLEAGDDSRADSVNAGAAAASTSRPVVDNARELGDAAAPSPRTLTPEEQMALYEQDLKENDWGHQPC